MIDRAVIDFFESRIVASCACLLMGIIVFSYRLIALSSKFEMLAGIRIDCPLYQVHHVL